MKIKVSEATPLQLNWLVAKCTGEPEETLDPLTWECTAYPSGCYSYSTRWARGGPIIERERIELIHYGSMGYEGAWEAQIGQDIHYIDQSPGDAMPGATPLIAAMRCYVASKLGDEVDVPEELFCNT